MKKQFYTTFILATICVYCGILVSPALAATTSNSAPAPNYSNNGQALEIAPPLVTMSVNPGQVTSFQIYLRDISSGDLIVTGQANDFVAEGEDGTPKIILNDTTSDPYSLKDWVTPPQSLLLVPRQIKTMTVSLKIPSNASPGGHYGVIRFTATPPNLQGTGVSLSASLGALLLLTVSGNIKESLSTQQFTVDHGGKMGSFFESGPLNFTEVYKNTGNVHVEPVGQITITDVFDKKLAALNVDLPPKNVLPASSRKFTEPLDSTVIGNKFLFGRYRATMNVVYGTSKKTLSDSLVFWVIPYRLIAVLIVVIIAGYFALRYLINRYNKHILDRAQRTQRRD